MKALSVKQPWADRIAFQGKTIETRTWSTNYRGWLLIVASKNPPGPRAGQAIAVAKMIDCRPCRQGDEVAAQCEVWPDLYAWVFGEVHPIQPFAVRGALQIYEVDITEAEVAQRLLA